MDDSPNIKDSAITQKTLALAVSGLVSTVLLVAAFYVWIDDRVMDGVHNYAAESIYPRLTRNEREIESIYKTLKSANETRAQQYRDLIKNQQAIIKDLREPNR